MKTWLLNIWDWLWDSFWFLPTLIAVSALLLGFFLPLMDLWLEFFGDERYFWLTTTPDSAQAILSTLAGSMITVAGVVFSITMVTFSITSSQFGSRLLRTFMQDKVVQSALGGFIGTSLYCFIVLRSIYEGTDGDDSSFVPNVAVVVGILLSILSLGIWIYFIHHVAVSIQAQHIARAVSIDLNAAIDRLFPELLTEREQPTPPPQDVELRNTGEQASGEGQHEEAEELQFDEESPAVTSSHQGYLQAIDFDTLVEVASEHDVAVQLLVRPGDFIAYESVLLRFSREASLDERLCRRINNAFFVGYYRTPRQDVECSIQELVEITVRALSPGINDPFTAISCIDYLGASLSRLAMRDIPAPIWRDEEHRLRVIGRQVSFRGALNEAFDQLRQHGKANVAVVIRLLEALERIASVTVREEDQQAIFRQASMIDRSCASSVPDQNDRADVHMRFDRVRHQLELRAQHVARTSPR